MCFICTRQSFVYITRHLLTYSFRMIRDNNIKTQFRGIVCVCVCVEVNWFRIILRVGRLISERE